MSDLLAARSQMAISLAFHIIFAAMGIGLPLLMAISEWLWLRRRDEVYLRLTRAWAKGAAIFFAVGAVSGTVQENSCGEDVPPTPRGRIRRVRFGRQYQLFS
jgi:cytochrome d ubiquinol oxidase subunit I